jgi:PAS domain S-box-containing protein
LSHWISGRFQYEAPKRFLAPEEAFFVLVPDKPKPMVKRTKTRISHSLSKSMGMESTMLEITKNRHDLLDLIQVAFIITDVHLKVVYSNRCTERLFGYAKGEIEGQPMRVLFLEDDLNYFLPNIAYFTLYKNGFEGDALLKQKDGTKLFVTISTASFKEEGEVFLTFSLQEIQRLKRMEKERLEAEYWTRLGKIVEEIVHQVRNPIVSIGGYTQRLLKPTVASQKSEFYLDQVVRETRRLETMIQRVEEYALMPRPTFQREEIQDVVDAALQAFSKGATEKGVCVNLDTGAFKGGGSLFIDKSLVIKALSHIFENSLEAMSRIPVGKERATLNVGLFGDEEAVGISISDKGGGIAKENLGRIFDPFFSTQPDRLGFGLTFAKRVVEEQGGKIRVESELGRGTAITISFPRDRRRQVRRELISPEAIRWRD